MALISFQEFADAYSMGNFGVPGDVGTELWDDSGDILGIFEDTLVYTRVENWAGDLYTVADLGRWAVDRYR